MRLLELIPLRASYVRVTSTPKVPTHLQSQSNFRCKNQLIETLALITSKAEKEGVNVVIETHALTIMGTPEINQEVINEIGSNNLSVVMDYKPFPKP